MHGQISGISYLRTTKLLDTVDVTRQTIWRWRQDGKIPTGHLFRGRQVVFSPDEVAAIEAYGDRIDPIDSAEAAQLSLFNGNGRKN